MFVRLLSYRLAWLCVLGCVLGGLLPGLLWAYYPPKPADLKPLQADVSVLSTELEVKLLSEVLGGKTTFLFYYLPTCSHCQAAAPAVKKLYERYGKKLPFLGVASGRSRLSDVRAFAELYGLDFPMVQDSSSGFAQGNALRGTPAFILTDGVRTLERASSYSSDFDALLEVWVKRAIGEDPISVLTPDNYHGSTVCATCHREAYVGWSLTHHSVAMASLFRVGKQENPECVRCHVVAYGQTGGYTDMEHTSHLGQVGCETCHGKAGGHGRPRPSTSASPASSVPSEAPAGAASTHKASGTDAAKAPTKKGKSDTGLAAKTPAGSVGVSTAGGDAARGSGAASGPAPQVALAQKLGWFDDPDRLAAVAATYAPTCVSCHDAQHTLAFDLKKALPLAAHTQLRDVDEASWLEKRTLLAQGQADKPLLEFPAGKIQGDSACVPCHPAHVEMARSERHGVAMETLRRAGKADQVDCVRCHATRKDPERAQALDAYAERVGCESCHGPAQAHVAAGGGKGNIVALTGSCPLCVIESICSDCHTPEHDADWSIEPALAKVRDWHAAARKVGGNKPLPAGSIPSR